MPRRSPLAASISAVLLALSTPAPSTAQLGAPVEAFVVIEPRPVHGGNEIHLAYELHVTNFARRPLALREIAVSTSEEGETVASFGADQLSDILRRPGLAPDSATLQRIDGGMRAIVFIWITIAGADVPSKLIHTITFADADDSVRTVSTQAVSIGSESVPIGPPLRGTNWFAANGPHNSSGHRRAMIPLEGHPWIAQRFAIDWVQIENGSTSSGDPDDNENYYAWGEDAIAVADGVVASVKDGIPENVPGLDSRAVPITLETVGGNYVILDLGNGQYAFYAHLQPGSLRVGVGDRVQRGDVLGLVGNSGNSTEPHLHFHISDGNSPLASEGLPYLIDEFDVLGSSAGFGNPFNMLASPESRTGQIPMANELVRFTP